MLRDGDEGTADEIAHLGLPQSTNTMTAAVSPERFQPKARVVPKYTRKSSTIWGMMRMNSRYTRRMAFRMGF